MGAAAKVSEQQTRYIESLRTERDRFVALAFCAADVLFEVDDTLKITFSAGASESLTGHAPDDFIGKDFLDLINEIDRPVIAELIRGMQNGVRMGPVAVRLASQAPEIPPLALTGYHLPDLPQSIFFALRLSNGTQAARSDRVNDRDAKTGLLGKDAFAELASERLREAKNRGEQVKLTMVRLPAMPDLCNRLDREAAESLQRAISACLRVGAGRDEIAARFDDQNYGIVHDANVNVGDIEARLEEHTKSADPAGAGAVVTTGTVSSDVFELNGVNAVKAFVHTINEFCETTGDELTHATLSSKLETLAQSASKRLGEFRTIISAELFDVAFQPIVAIDDRSIHHFEALARFGGGSEQSPYELITFAENTGLICDFDYAMCRKILHLIKQMKAQGETYHIAVNLSGNSIANAAFLDTVQRLLSDNEPWRRQLLIEITESAQIPDLESANKAIQRLRQAGHKVCLDDFGAGASAFRYLHMLDVDIVKIDGYYIQDAIRQTKNRAFLRSIARLCSELGIETVAERVEDEATVEILRECGIEYAQGFLFGRPHADITSFS